MVFASGLYLRWVRIVQKTQVFAKPLNGGTANILINFETANTSVQVSTRLSVRQEGISQSRAANLTPAEPKG